MSFKKEFSKNIIILRKKCNISQNDLAKKMGVSRSYINSLEKGTKNPSLNTILKISRALNVSITELIKNLEDIKYLFVKNLLKKSIEKYNDKNWYHQRFDGSPYMLSIIAEAETKIAREIDPNLAFKVHFCFFEENIADWYIWHNDIDRISNIILKKIKENENYCKNLIHSWSEKETELEVEMKNFDINQIYKMSNEQLLRKNFNFVNLSVSRFASSPIIDGFALGSDKILNNRLKKIYQNKSNNKNIPFSKFFSTLTAPIEHSFLSLAELDLYKFAIKIKKHPKRKNDIINEYTDKYFWIRNNYIDSLELSFSYFETIIMKLVTYDIRDLKEHIDKIENNKNSIIKQKEKLFKDFNIDEYTKRIIKATELMTNWQDERKKSTMLCTHFLSLILKEVSRRTGIDEVLLKYLSPRELNKAFDNDIEKELKLLRKKSLFCWTYDGFEYTHNNKDIDYIKSEILANKNNDEIKDFRGITASVGKFIGKVVILESAKDINTVKQGDVLVTIMTRPDYVPAMKRAGAIVTNEGGITCHAAIISRELKIPCVIGTKIATEVLNNGDLIEVNANHGIIKILKSNQS